MDQAAEVKATNTPADIVASASEVRLAASAEALLFNYVLTNGKPKDRHLPSIMKMLSRTVELGHASWPLELRSLCHGKDVLDFGCGSTLYGPAFRALGARSYTGVDKALDPTRKRFRSRLLKKSVDYDFSLSDVTRVFPGVSYMRADDVISQGAYDVVLLQSVTHSLLEPQLIFEHLHRALRPNGEIWLLHENFYAWAGHQREPRNPTSYDSSKPEQKAFVDWGHVKFEPPEGHPFLTTLNRIRLGDLRQLLDRYFEVDVWKEIPDRSSIQARLTPAIRKSLSDFADRELLTKQVIVRGRKRL